MNSVFESKTVADCLQAATGEVLSTMFFAEVEPLSGPVAAGGERLGVTLPFHGAATGQLRLTIDQPVAERLAANFYGADSTLPEARNVLAELANMVCGTLLSRLDTGAIFCLGEPQAMEATAPLASETALLLRVEEGLLALQFEIEAAGELAAGELAN